MNIVHGSDRFKFSLHEMLWATCDKRPQVLLLSVICFWEARPPPLTKMTSPHPIRQVIEIKSTYNMYFISSHIGCNSKNVTLNLWPHLGDGVSSTRPERQIVRVIFSLECFDSRAEFKGLHHQGVTRDWETIAVTFSISIFSFSDVCRWFCSSWQVQDRLDLHLHFWRHERVALLHHGASDFREHQLRIQLLPLYPTFLEPWQMLLHHPSCSWQYRQSVLEYTLYYYHIYSQIQIPESCYGLTFGSHSAKVSSGSPSCYVFRLTYSSIFVDPPGTIFVGVMIIFLCITPAVTETQLYWCYDVKWGQWLTASRCTKQHWWSRPGPPALPQQHPCHLEAHCHDWGCSGLCSTDKQQANSTNQMKPAGYLSGNRELRCLSLHFFSKYALITLTLPMSWCLESFFKYCFEWKESGKNCSWSFCLRSAVTGCKSRPSKASQAERAGKPANKPSYHIAQFSVMIDCTPGHSATLFPEAKLQVWIQTLVWLLGYSTKLALLSVVSTCIIWSSWFNLTVKKSKNSISSAWSNSTQQHTFFVSTVKLHKWKLSWEMGRQKLAELRTWF